MADSLSAFYRENATQKKEVEYVVSKRFHDEEGNPIPWVIRPLSVVEAEKITDRNIKNVQIKGTREWRKDFNQAQTLMDMTIAAVVTPNLNDERLQSSYEVNGAEALLKTMLTPGELSDLQLAVNEASGFESGMAGKIKEVKN